MADKPKTEPEPKRLNRAVGVSEALGHVLDKVLKKRGFATRDLLSNWAAMAPKPYDALAVPAELRWPRGAGHEGATLYLRVAPGHAMAIAHEAPIIAQAVNRYFGYFLVREVRLSAEPMVAPKRGAPKPDAPDPEAARAVEDRVSKVDDAALKDALAGLGTAMLGKRNAP